MKRIRRGGCLALAMLLLLSLMPLAHADDEGKTWGPLTYYVQDGEIMIGRCDHDYEGKVTVPAEIDGLPVTKIFNTAFFACQKLTEVELPDTVRSIGDNAFGNSPSLVRVTIPDTVEYVGSTPFLNSGIYKDETNWNGDALYVGPVLAAVRGKPESLTVRPGTTAIAGSLMAWNGELSNLVLPDSLLGIGPLAFAGCKQLETIALPDGLRALGQGVFEGCEALKEIRLPAGVTEIPKQAFWKCTALERVTMEGPVTRIGEEAFWACSALESLDLPQSVDEIGAGAMKECAALKTVTMPDTLSVLGQEAFKNCTSLTSITVPFGITQVEQQTFYGCRAAASVSLPETLKIVADEGFAFCSSLSEVTLPSSLREIWWHGFAYCGFTSVELPEGVRTLSAGAFAWNRKLNEITFPATLTKLGEGCFEGSAALENFRVAADNPTYRDIDGVLFDKAGTELIAYPLGRDGAYTVPDGVTAIAPFAFAHSDVTAVTLPEGIRTIGEKAFYVADALREINFPEGLQTIGAYAFHKTALVEALIPDTVTSYGQEAFSFCEKLEAVRLSKQADVINGMFMYCSKLTQVIIPEGVRAIRAGAFANCSVLGEVYIPRTMQRIETNTFSGCSYLQDVYYGGSEAEWYNIEMDRYNGNYIEVPTRHYYALVIDPDMPFRDVPMNAYYYEGVKWALQANVTNGTGPDAFSPEAICTRGQVVTFLWRANGSPEPESTVNPFTDVAPDQYYYKAVLWAVEQGITNGTSKTTFSPDAPCTRAHVVTFLWRSEGEPVSGGANPFADVPASAYYTPAVLWAVNHDPQITNGTSPTTFSPDSNCTRGQIVTFLYRDQ